MMRGSLPGSDPRVAILSTGHAGSAYIAAVLNKVGVRCGHESVYSLDLDLGTGLHVDSSWLALPYIEAGQGPPRVFHQVRHPLKVLSSVMAGLYCRTPDQPMRLFRETHTDLPAPAWDAPASEWLPWWVWHLADWQDRCDAVAEHTWKVEQVDSNVAMYVAAAAGSIVGVGAAKVALRQVPKNTNKHPDGPKITWSDIEGMPRARELRRWYPR